jgi:hypothetical protein
VPPPLAAGKRFGLYAVDRGQGLAINPLRSARAARLPTFAADLAQHATDGHHDLIK